MRTVAWTALGLCVAAVGQAPTNYYNSVVTTTPAQLRATLHAVIDDHQRFPYTSGSTDTWDILKVADEDPQNSGRILDVYRNASYPCLLYTSPSPRDATLSRMPSSA